MIKNLKVTPFEAECEKMAARFNFKTIAKHPVTDMDAQQVKRLERTVHGAHRERIHIILLAMPAVKVIKAKLGMPKGVYKYLAKSETMQKAIKENELGYYSPVFDEMTDWIDQNIALDEALTACEKKVVGSAGWKATALSDLKITLDFALGYINKIAVLNQPNAITIIESAYMVVINMGTRVISDITISLLPAANAVEIKCPRLKIDGKPVEATYHKAYSIDGGKTWIPLTSTNKCKIKVFNLTSGVPVIGRSCFTNSKLGTSPWIVSTPVTPQ